MFAYCLNNPVCFSDYVGAEPIYSIDVNDDGEDDCFVYAYIFDGLFSSGRNVGYVYFFRGIDDSFLLDESNWPNTFNPDTDLMVVDYTDRDNGTLFAFQAQKVNNRHHSAIVELMFEYVSDYQIEWDRTKESVLSEWKSHNFFAFASPRAQNVDFDEAEEGEPFSYYVKKAWNAFLS